MNENICGLKKTQVSYTSPVFVQLGTALSIFLDFRWKGWCFFSQYLFCQVPSTVLKTRQIDHESRMNWLAIGRSDKSRYPGWDCGWLGTWEGGLVIDVIDGSMFLENKLIWIWVGFVSKSPQRFLENKLRYGSISKSTQGFLKNFFVLMDLFWASLIFETCPKHYPNELTR